MVWRLYERGEHAPRDAIERVEHCEDGIAALRDVSHEQP
jgi:hypothetical protein